MNKILNLKKHTYELYIEAMKNISPLDKLSKGYAYVKANGKPLKSVSNVNKSDEILLYLKDGTIKSVVSEVIQEELS